MTHFRTAPWRALSIAVALATPGALWAFQSGSTGTDGALTPAVNTQVTLPPSGVLNYTQINIPAGVTVTFLRNTTNTPVVLLVAGDATIAGTLDVSGTASTATGAGGDGNIGDDGMPGIGGPGGYDGGRGGQVGESRMGGAGLGPGGGIAGFVPSSNCGSQSGGGGGGHGANGTSGWISGCVSNVSPGGAMYGSSALLPLLGGSGGGGGAGGTSFVGSGGGGGGGALLIAASGTIQVTGAIRANGGASGASGGLGCGATGGGGSGGAIRLIATTISGNGAVSAAGGGGTFTSSQACGGASVRGVGGDGAIGRIRFEAETYTRTAASTPPHSFGAPGDVFIAGTPTLAITSIGGVEVPAAPTGVADVSLPASTVNPVTVLVRTTGVPVGNTVTVTVIPAHGSAASAVSTALAGSTAQATASAELALPPGPSTLQASVTYTIVAALGDALSRFAQNERVEQITLTAMPGQPAQVMLVTATGQRYPASARALRIAAQGG